MARSGKPTHSRKPRRWWMTVLAVGGAAWMLVKRAGRGGARPDQRPRPTLTPEQTPPPEHADTESVAPPTSTGSANGDTTSPPGSTPAEEAKPDEAADGKDPDLVDEAMYESFPASDPPSWTR